jgi:RimJ/RimL family protein N-acetyltransferase
MDPLIWRYFVAKVETDSDFQGKGVNRWAKFLMLRHAFEGRQRDAVYYSMLRQEWPPVREQLRTRPKVVPAGTGA